MKKLNRVVIMVFMSALVLMKTIEARQTNHQCFYSTQICMCTIIDGDDVPCFGPYGICSCNGPCGCEDCLPDANCN